MLKTKKTHETLIRIPLENFHNIQDTVNATKKTKPKYSNNAWINEAIVEKLNHNPLNDKTLENKYIDWASIFVDEVLLDMVDEDEKYYKLAKALIEELKQESIELLALECELTKDGFQLVFSESGGTHEGDSQGWHRAYCVVCDYDYLVTDITYEQG